MDQHDHGIDVLAVEVERLQAENDHWCDVNAELLAALDAHGETIARLEDENAGLLEQLNRLVAFEDKEASKC